MAVFASQVRDVYTGLGEEKRELKGTRITKGTTENTGDKEKQREKGRKKGNSMATKRNRGGKRNGTCGRSFTTELFGWVI